MPILLGQLLQAFLQDRAQPAVLLGVALWRSRLRPPREPLQQGGITPLLSSGVAGRAAGQHLEPAPKGLLALKHARITDHAQQSLLQGLLCFVLAPARDHQQELIDPIEVLRMELAKSFLLPRRQPSREQRDAAARGLRRGNLFHRFGSG